MSYGGDVSPKECWDALRSNSSAVLVDVRTRAEWAYVGVPKLSQDMNQMIGQEWMVFPEMQVDEEFVSQLQQKLSGLGLDNQANLYFLCKGGVRSLAAARAMTAAGYPNTYNIAFGFEGQGDENSHRGNINGWKADGLPWHQQ